MIHCTGGTTMLEAYWELIFTVGSGGQMSDATPVESLGRESRFTAADISEIIEAIKGRAVFVNTPPHGGQPDPWEVP